MINEVKLQVLLKEFNSPRPEFNGESYVTRRREWFDVPMERISPLLARDKLRSLTIDQARTIYKEMTVGGPQLYPRSFIENGIDRIRCSLEYLIYGDDPLETRFFNVAGNIDSDYHLVGVGRAFASTALLLYDSNQFGVWNGAIDGGLTKLGLFSGKKRGEYLGQTYIRVLDILKELQQKCGFLDLSTTDEFVELIYHGKIGEQVYTQKPLVEEAITEELLEPGREDIHLKIQWMLARIGDCEGHDVWVAINDYKKEFNGDLFSSFCLSDLPIFAGPEVLRVARSIDVIWFKKKSAQPIRFFEIEHTTSVFSGLLRLNDVKIDYPLPRATIVAPSERKGTFENQISRRTFVHSELEEVCDYMVYEDVERLFNSEKVRTQMLS